MTAKEMKKVLIDELRYRAETANRHTKRFAIGKFDDGLSKEFYEHARKHEFDKAEMLLLLLAKCECNVEYEYGDIEDTIYRYSFKSIDIDGKRIVER